MQEILGLVRRCVEDYDMIQAGDTVAVGVSGGKDSLLTLTALARLSRFYPKPFRVVAMTVEAGTPGMRSCSSSAGRRTPARCVPSCAAARSRLR